MSKKPSRNAWLLLICGIINMVMKGAENRKTRKTSDRICMYGRADTGRPSAQKNR